ncbi:MAG: acyl-CoA dehydrogenase family protein [Gammaproteobacteria bacterium]|nr:acyl-CoA dehydrogenase family protein [Gammaproteobacteria bacterium]
MDFELDNEQRQIRDTFARFSDEQVAPCAAEFDERHEFPLALFRRLGDMGFFAMRYPESLGGSDTGLLTYCLALTELARGSMAFAAAASMQSLMGTQFLHLLGNADLHRRLLRPALAGEKIGAICLTEPNAGSDLDGIATHAESVNDGYVLTGQKTWVSMAPLADFFTVFAKAGPEKKLTIFLVERGQRGLCIGKPIEKMGVCAFPTSEVTFDDCFIPATHRLSRDFGDGEVHLRELLGQIRIITAALAIGCGTAALDAAVRYAGERKQFGKPINRFQAIQMKLAEMATDLEAARRFLFYAAWLVDRDLPHHKESAMCKLFASEAAVSVCDKAARVLASYGFAAEYPVQRYLRDIRFTLIGGGTSEILKLIIASQLSP